MNEVQQVLVKARDLISDSSRWTQGADAVDSRGQFGRFNDPDACKWCLRGALLKVCGGWNVPATRAVDAFRAVADSGMVSFNDYHSHADVIAMLDRAIQRAGVTT